MSQKSLSVKIAQANILLRRLEKISADSTWSHRASGIRASLAKTLACIHVQAKPTQEGKLDQLMAQGYHVLEEAARDIPEDPSSIS